MSYGQLRCLEFSAKEKLEIVSVRGEAAHFAPPHPSRAPRGEGRIPFELFPKGTENKKFFIIR